jgi:RHS repeat-associated protein
MPRPVVAVPRLLLLGACLLAATGVIASVASASTTKQTDVAVAAVPNNPFGLSPSRLNPLTGLIGHTQAAPAGLRRRLTTHISGQTYTTNQEWTTSGSPYVVDGTVTVASGVTLTVDPGVIVKFNGTAVGLTINGTLSAIGTSGSRITFTSYQDDTAGGDTNGDGTATTGAKGQWRSIYGLSGGHVNISYADIRYGGSSSSAGMVDTYGSNTQVALDHDTLSYSGIADLWENFNVVGAVTNTTISYAQTRGIGINLAVVTVANSTIQNNYDGLWYQLDASHPGNTVSNTIIQNNTHDGIYLPFDNTTTSDKLPFLYRLDITGNGNYAMEGAANNKNRKLIARLLWLGTGAYYWYNPGGCSTLGSPNAIGEVANRSSNQTIPTGPISGGTYSVFPNGNTQINCGYSTFDLRGQLARSPVANLLAYLPDWQTLGDCPVDSSTDPVNTAAGGFEFAVAAFAANLSACRSDPVNTATGDFMQAVTDASLPGIGASFNFTRYYNSLDTETGGPLGIGWTDNYNARLEIQANGDVLAVSPTSQQGYYTKQSNGTYVGDPGVWATLSKSGSTYNLVGKNQATLTFDSSGKLTSMVDRNNKGLSFSYNGNGRLSTVTDASGRQMTLAYNSSNELSSTTLPGSRTVSYTYVASGSGNSGQLATVTDLRGKLWTYAYTAGNFLQKLTDPLNHVIFNNTYDTDGRVLTQKDALNNQTSFSWDASSQTETVNDPRSHTWKDIYSNNLLQSRTDPLNNTTSFGSDTSMNQTSITGPNGKSVTLSYDSNGNLASASSADLGATKTLTYDSKNDLTSVTDPRGKVTSYSYDSSGNLTSVVQDGATVASYTYTAGGLKASSVDGNNHETDYAYDSNGNLTSSTDPLGKTTTYTYDAAGRPLTVTDPLNHTDTYTYNAAGQVLTETDPLNHTTVYTYDAAGNRLTVTDALNQTTTFGYDADNQVTSITDPLNHTTTYAYDGAGNKTSETDPNNHTTSYTYDADNRLISATDALGKTTSYSYDSNGNETAVTDPLNHTTSYTYDLAGRMLSQTDALNDSTTYTYDKDGNQASVSDANGHTATFTYDAAGRILTSTDPLGNTTTYTYDAAGNKTSVQDANSHTTTYGYDALGRQTTVTSPLNETWTKTYNASGEVSQLTLPSGDSVSYSYDNDGRLTAIDYSDSTPDITYSYDAVGNRTQMSDGVGTQNYSYDAANRLTSVSRGTGNTFTYTYDANGNVTGRTYPDGTTSTYGYDADNRLTSLASGGQTTTYSYDDAGHPISTDLPNGITSTRTYDGAGRLTTILNALSGATVSGLAYTLDAVGNPSQIVRTGTLADTQTYTYDEDNRLTAVCYQSSCPNGSDPFVRYTYDAVGNRLTEADPSGTTSYSYNSGDELTAAGSTTYIYDANGNETSAGSSSYSHNAAGQLVSATVGGTTTSLTYDGDGNVTQATDGTTTTKYRWDTNYTTPLLATETDGTNSLLRRYLYGTSRVSMTEGGNTFYYLTDSLGSVTDLTDASGNSEWAYLYDPFGESRTESKIDPGAPVNLMKFAGELWNPETGLYDLQARQYDPSSGRFLSIDPAEGSAGAPAESKYAYTEDRPTVMVDPSGATSYPSQAIEYSEEAASSGVGTAGGINRSRVVWYLHHWAHGTNPEYGRVRNPLDGEDDCTNFVSQALRYGGWSEDSTWYAEQEPACAIDPYTGIGGCMGTYTHFSSAWDNTKAFTSWSTSSGRAVLRGYPEDSPELGDVIVADWDGAKIGESYDVAEDHMMGITGFDGRQILISSHTHDRLDFPLWEDYPGEDSVQKLKPYALFGLIHIK